MTKKKVEVNEDILKNIIVGDIPVFGREQPMNENTEQRTGIRTRQKSGTCSSYRTG